MAPARDDDAITALARGAWTLAALGRLARSGTLQRLRTGDPVEIEDPVERADAAVLAAVGLARRDADGWSAAGALAGSRLAGDPAAVAGWVSSQLGQALRHAEGSPAGWVSADPAVLRGQGRSSAIWPRLFATEVFGRLDGVTESFAAGGRFLDVGVGVAALSIAFCRQFPRAEVVGLDVFEPALAVAREEVAAAGLGDRIELHAGSIEGLRDRASFDLAWLPQPFIAPAALGPGLRRVREALRPGGWLILAVSGRADTPFDELGALLAGGGPLGVEEALEMLAAHGFADGRPLELSVPLRVVAARRPPG